MKISTKGRYALRLMIDIADQPEGSIVSLKEISLRQGISVKYLEQIVSVLSKNGFLKSIRGPQGGYRLSRSPEEYTVGAIIRATEGSLAPVACLEDEHNNCDRCSQCATVEFWEGLDHLVRDYMDSYTLADLLWNKREKAGNAGEV